MRCSRCQTTLPADARFCPNCGASRPSLPPAFAEAKRRMTDMGPDPHAYQNELHRLIVRHGDDSWVPHPSGTWYWWDGQQWLPRDPPSAHEPTPAPTTATRPAPLPSTPLPQRARRVPRWLWIAVPVAVVLLAACVVTLFRVRPWHGLGLAQSATPTTSASPDDTVVPTATTDPLVAQPLVLSPQQADLVAEFGWPHSFSLLQVPDDEGRSICYETWTYHDGETTYVFLDGAYVGWEPAEPVAGDIVATPYLPTQFALGATPQQVSALLADGEWAPLFTSGQLIENAEVFLGPQLIAGFASGRLIYLEAVALALVEEAS